MTQPGKPTPRSEIAKLSRNVFRAFNGADVFRKAWMVTIYIHDKNVKANKLVGSCTNKRLKKNYNKQIKIIPIMLSIMVG